MSMRNSDPLQPLLRHFFVGEARHETSSTSSKAYLLRNCAAFNQTLTIRLYTGSQNVSHLTVKIEVKMYGGCAFALVLLLLILTTFNVPPALSNAATGKICSTYVAAANYVCTLLICCVNYRIAIIIQQAQQLSFISIHFISIRYPHILSTIRLSYQYEISLTQAGNKTDECFTNCKGGSGFKHKPIAIQGGLGACSPRKIWKFSTLGKCF